MSEPLLSARELTVRYGHGGAATEAVRGISLELRAGEILGLVGESGSGKSSIGYAVMGHLGSNGRAEGELRFEGIELVGLPKSRWAGLRGRRIGMVYQEPQSALNPSYTVGEQVAEGLRHHFGLSHAAAAERATDWLGRVLLPDPAGSYHRYPHQLSGGQLQRVVIAMAFALEPALVVMDEPTTGLDVTTQAHILDLVADLRARTGVGILYISHDLAVVSELCERVIVMHRGRVVEEGAAANVLSRPRHPYTQRLVASIPSLTVRQALRATTAQEERAPSDAGCSFRTRCPGAVEACAGPKGSEILSIASERVRCWRTAEIVPLRPTLLEPPPRRSDHALLELRQLGKTYRSGRMNIVACEEVSFSVRKGESVALIGESGSGKTTIAKCVLGLEAPTTGHILIDGTPLPARVHDRPRLLRRRVQIVFQNPDSTLNGRRTVAATLSRPLLIHGRARDERAADLLVRELLAGVDLPAEYAGRYPHELSGGEKQRVAIARALACEPDLIVCDEPVSALDVSVQGTVLDLCRRLQSERGLGFLFITHDLGVVRQIAERSVVMLHGRVCHEGDIDSLFAPNAHPYVRELIASVPGAGRPAGSGEAGRLIGSRA